MLNFILGASNTGKTSTIAQKIADLVHDNREIIVIIPEQFTFEYENMLYSQLGAFDYNKISVLSFKRLSSRIMTESGCTLNDFADNVTKSLFMSLAIKQTIRNDGLPFYEKTAKNASFPAMMLDCISDLQQSGIDDAKLIEGMNYLDGTLKEKFCDILNIYFTYNSILQKHNLADSQTTVTQSAAAANKSGFFEGKVVFIDEFKSFTSDQNLLIEEALKQTDVFVALDTDDEYSKLLYLHSVNKTFGKLKQAAQKVCTKIVITRCADNNIRKNSDIQHLCANIFKNKKCEKIKSDNIKIVDAVNIYDECEYICAEIRNLVTTENIRFDEIAIVARNAKMYESLIDEYADIYEIPLFKSIEKTPANTALSIFIASALELAFGDFSTESILYYAKTMLTSLDISQISALENFCYIWGIDGKLWEKEFTQKDNNLEIAESCRKKLIEPVVALREKCKNADGASITKAIYEHFEAINLKENLKNLAQKYIDDDNEIENARELKLLWNCICDTLDIFYKYLEGVEISPKEYKDMFLSALSKAQFTNAPQKTNCVCFSQIQLTRYASPKVVFVIGANEGYFPRNSVTTGVFSSNETQKLADSSIELAKSDEQIYSEECFAAFAAVSAPSQKLYITYPMLDKSNSSCTGAHTLKQIEDMFENRITLCANSLPPQFYCTTKKAAYRKYVQNFNQNSVFTKSCEKALEADKDYAEKINALKLSGAKSQFALENKDNILGLYSNNLKMSASKLESFCSCPFKFFMGYGLKVRPLQKKSITVNEKGSIVHYCLEQIFKQYCRQEFLLLDSDTISHDIKTYIKNYCDENLGGDYRESKRFDYELDVIAQNTATIIENLKAEFSQSDFYPCEFEYYLKKDYRLDINDIENPKVTLSGITDRIDLYISDKEKFIRVIDYKTGTKTFSMSDLLSGKNMQMFLYLFALTNDDKKYKNHTPCGVLYYHANEEKPTLSRNSGEAELLKEHTKNRRMIGVILNSDEIIDSMDKNSSGFIPVSRNKDGSISKASQKNLLDKAAFDYLDRYCSETLKRCSKQILSGKIAAIPQSDACTYCDYKNVCNNYPNEIISTIAEDSEKLVKDMLSGNYSYGDCFKTEIVDSYGKDDENVDE